MKTVVGFALLCFFGIVALTLHLGAYSWTIGMAESAGNVMTPWLKLFSAAVTFALIGCGWYLVALVLPKRLSADPSGTVLVSTVFPAAIFFEAVFGNGRIGGFPGLQDWGDWEKALASCSLYILVFYGLYIPGLASWDTAMTLGLCSLFAQCFAGLLFAVPYKGAARI